MGDADYLDGDFSDEDEHEWIFAEDHYDLADELAEYTCPSPTRDLIDYPYDPYNYWEDLEYLQNDIFDYDPPGQKRKRPSSKVEGSGPKKKQKTKTSTVSPVLWMSNREMDEAKERDIPRQAAVVGRTKNSLALLPDWRERFRTGKGLGLMGNYSKTEVNDDVEVGQEDLQQAAGMLSEAQLEQIKTELRRQGLDPSALQVVLEDLIAGREPDLGEDEGDEEKEDADEDEDMDQSDSASLPAQIDGSDDLDKLTNGLSTGQSSKAIISHAESDIVMSTNKRPPSKRKRGQQELESDSNPSNGSVSRSKRKAEDSLVNEGGMKRPRAVLDITETRELHGTHDEVADSATILQTPAKRGSGRPSKSVASTRSSARTDTAQSNVNGGSSRTQPASKAKNASSNLGRQRTTRSHKNA